jgi:hypothetical protein
MRYKSALLLIVSIALTLPVRSQHSHPDFSGKWVVNMTRSDFGKTPDGRDRHPRVSKMEIKQDEKDLEVIFRFTDREGKERKTEYKYSLDGKKTKNEMVFGKQESTARWINKGQILQIDSKSHIKRGDMEFDMESVQYFSLVDGRLFIESVRNTPRGEMEQKAVYDRETDNDD